MRTLAGLLLLALCAAAPLAAAGAPEADTTRTARRLVVVDAGHGGRDPGASGRGGLREKDVALAVARRLAEALRRDPTLDVRMTRDRDTLIALRDRTRMANRWKEEGQTALFISVHCNAHPTSRAVRGYETYFLSEAKTEDARRVEAMENAAQEYEEEDAGGDPLQFIFNDLRQNLYLRESSDWAAIVQEELGEVLPGPDRGVRQAGFHVLNGAYMPAVLVEIGFVTNAQEEQMLGTRRWQDQIADGLAAAVRRFLDHADPPRASRAASR